MRCAKMIAAALCVAMLPLGSSARGMDSRRIRHHRGEDLYWRLPLEQKLTTRLDVDFRDERIEEVVNFIREVVEVNLVLDPRVHQMDVPLVTLSLRDLDAARVLEWVMNITGLEYGFANGAVFISTPAGVRRAEPKSFHIYDVRDITASPSRTRRVGDRDDDGDRFGDRDRDRDRNGERRGGGGDLVNLIVTLTGPEKWESVDVVGGREADDDAPFGGGDRFGGGQYGGSGLFGDAGWSGADDRDSGLILAGGREIVDIIIMHTGPENWEQVTVVGGREEDDDAPFRGGDRFGDAGRFGADGRDGGRDLVDIIVSQTGPENWEQVTVVGGRDEDDDVTFGAGDYDIFGAAGGERGAARAGGRELADLLLGHTGRENWESVTVVGDGEAEDGD